MILLLLSYVGIVGGLIALVLTIAAGLYYLSEQVEEHTVFAKRLLVRLILAIMAVHVMLVVFDGMPITRTLFSLGVNFAYLQTMRQFPTVQITSVSFICAAVGAIISHFIWFSYFSDDSIPPYSVHEHYPGYVGRTHPPFREIASFFGLLIWLIPFSLFISLSANDNVLPTANPAAADSHSPRRKGLAKQVVEEAWHQLSVFARKMGVDMSSPYDVIA